VNGKWYVGKTVETVNIRITKHVAEANRGKGYAFHGAIRKHGIDSFQIYSIAICETKQELNAAERFWIKKLGSLSPGGYNLAVGGEGGALAEESLRKIRGRVKSLEEREKLRIASTGRKHSEETKAHLSEVAKKRSPIEKMKAMSELARKVVLTPEQKERQLSGLKALRESGKHPCLGKKQSEEHLRKRSEAMKGRPRPDISERQRGRVKSLEERRKLSEARQGEKHPLWGTKWTEERKALHRQQRTGVKLSEKHKESLRAAWVLRKAKTLDRNSVSQSETIDG
jgi:group I intron endonuclease